MFTALLQRSDKTKSLLLDRFVDSLFNGSVSNLMMHLLDNRKASQKELDAISQNY